MDEHCWVVGPEGTRIEVGVPGQDRVRLLPAEVLRAALAHGWSTFTLLHSHPAGGAPSAADHALTRRLVAASEVIGVTLATHLVVAPGATYVVTGQRRAA